MLVTEKNPKIYVTLEQHIKDTITTSGEPQQTPSETLFGLLETPEVMTKKHRSQWGVGICRPVAEEAEEDIPLDSKPA